MRIEKLKQTFEIDATLVHFPLHPETPMEGRSMAELYAGRDVDPEAMYARMKGLMDAEGLPYGRRTHTTTAGSPRSSANGPTPSRAVRRSTSFVQGLFRRGAQHRRPRDPGGTRAIRRPLGGRGAGGADRAPLQGCSRRRLGEIAPIRVTGVPTFVADRYGVVGAQPYEVLEAARRQGRSQAPR